MDDKTAERLLAEYMQLQKTVEDFDAKAITIKAWSVTVSAAGIVGAYVEGVPLPAADRFRNRLGFLVCRGAVEGEPASLLSPNPRDRGGHGEWPRDCSSTDRIVLVEGMAR